MADLLTAFVIICAAIRPVHMLMRLPAAKARRRAIEQQELRRLSRRDQPTKEPRDADAGSMR